MSLLLERTNLDLVLKRKTESAFVKNSKVIVDKEIIAILSKEPLEKYLYFNGSMNICNHPPPKFKKKKSRIVCCF